MQSNFVSEAVRVPAKKRIAVNGVLLLDKPAGLSSNDALIKAKRLFNAKKAGHTGTLDPFATGLLPLCFGEATKFAQDLLEADKCYETTVELGVRTTTGDTEGDIIERCNPEFSAAQLHAVLAQFRGAIRQIPPMYSALKRDGKPLYEYARAGITLEREARAVTIHALNLIDYTAPYLKLSVKCSKGTYIRVLGEDIGAALGCGGHLTALRRTQVGLLNLYQAVSLEQIAAASDQERAQLLAAVDTLLQSYPAVMLDIELSQRFLHGQRLPITQHDLDLSVPRQVRVYREHDACLLGTAQFSQAGILAPDRLVAVQPE